MPDDADVSTWKINPAGMIRYFNNVTYTLHHAVADLVDNCIDNEATKIEIWMDYNRDTNSAPYLYVADNGTGISEDDWEDVMEIGKVESEDNSRLGTYGVGMKLSSLTQAEEITIYSKPPGQDERSLRRISKTLIESAGELILGNTTNPNPLIEQTKITELFDEGYNTIVTLESMHKMNLNVSMENTPEELFTDYKIRIRAHLGLTYHRILKSRGDTLEITINNSTIIPVDPFLMHESSVWHGTIRIEDSRTIEIVRNGGEFPLRVALHVIPHEKLVVNKPRSKQAHIIKKKSLMQGLYFYRNDRIIQYGGWHGIVSEVDPLQLARCSVEIPADYNKYFGVSPYKLAVEPAPAILSKLHEIFAVERDWGKLYK